MVDTFIIRSTSNTTSKNFLIKPGALDGPGSQNRHSDLRLYGLGSHQWGEGVIENLYRLLENSTCPQKESGDYYVPRGAYDYDPLTDPILPKSEHDLGPGNGITNPIQGQVWFNNSEQLAYIYSTEWIPIGGRFISFDGTSGSPQPTILNSKGIASIDRDGVGVYTISFSSAISNYTVTGSGNHATEPVIFSVKSITTTSVQVQFYALTSGLFDPTHASVVINQ